MSNLNHDLNHIVFLMLSVLFIIIGLFIKNIDDKKTLKDNEKKKRANFVVTIAYTLAFLSLLISFLEIALY